MAFDEKPSGMGETIFTIAVETFFAIGAGLLIVYIEPVFKYPKKYISYPFLAGTLWFVLRGFVILSQNKGFIHKTLSGAIINILTALIFGLTLAFVYKILDKKQSR